VTAIVYAMTFALVSVFLYFWYRSRKQDQEVEKRVRDGDV